MSRQERFAQNNAYLISAAIVVASCLSLVYFVDGAYLSMSRGNLSGDVAAGLTALGHQVVAFFVLTVSIATLGYQNVKVASLHILGAFFGGALSIPVSYIVSFFVRTTLFWVTNNTTYYMICAVASTILSGFSILLFWFVNRRGS